MRTSKTGLFLMELILAIMFLALSSAVCIQIFAKSHQIDTTTINTNHAVIWSQNMAESFYSNNGNLDELYQIWQNEQADIQGKDSSQLTVSVYLNEDYAVISNASSAVFTCTAVYDDPAYEDELLTAQGGFMRQAHITFTSIHEEAPIYEMTIEKYIPLSGGIANE